MYNTLKKTLPIFFCIVYATSAVRALKAKPQMQTSSQLSISYLTIKKYIGSFTISLFNKTHFENYKMQTQ